MINKKMFVFVLILLVVMPVFVFAVETVSVSDIDWDGNVVSFNNKYDDKVFVSFAGSPLSLSDCDVRRFPCYLRESSPRFIELEEVYNGIEKRGVIEWDVSSIPDYIDVVGVKMRIFFFDYSSSGMNVNHMEKTHIDYTDDSRNCGGNCHFYDDMGNGSVYDYSSYSFGGGYYIDVPLDSISEFQDSLSSGVFSVGLDVDSGGNARIASGSDYNFSRRPQIIIDYNNPYANETEGDDATETGVKNVIPGVEIHDDQKVYLISSSGEQSLGTFDKFAVHERQRWALNYISVGESPTGMESLSTRLLALELDSLQPEEIVNEVENFISSTID